MVKPQTFFFKLKKKTIENNFGIFYRKLVNVTKNETYSERSFTQGVCPNNPKSQCMIPHIEKKMRTVTKEVMRSVPVYHCHDGYEERNKICFPICKTKCKNGFCSAPELCECFEGYATDKNEYVL